MAVAFLDFEQPIAELEAKIEELKHVTSDSEVNIQEEISRLQAKSRQLTTSIFANLTPWQITQLARHPHRPYTLDYVAAICTEFCELHGDRMYADDLAIVGGLGRIDGRAVMIIGHQKGRDTKERVRRNYGMPKPEGLSQGAASDAPRRALRAAAGHAHRHAGRVSRCRRRGARPERGDRAQPVRDVGAAACRS